MILDQDSRRGRPNRGGREEPQAQTVVSTLPPHQIHATIPFFTSTLFAAERELTYPASQRTRGFKRRVRGRMFPRPQSKHYPSATHRQLPWRSYIF